MLDVNQSINLTATSFVEENNTRKQIAYMNATIPQNGNVSINKNIQDKALFEQNEEEVLKDFAEFEKIVYKKAKE